ncbi:ParB/RepB/Spo0J family partition protein [candidate division WOR-3 bacterium]|nr:ParB/RepB/Spo0J family partition protein [candidate division WOR-3 bacterium]
MARKALGKGIDALIPAQKRDVTHKIPIKLVADNPYQPRKVTGKEVSELAASIKEHGLLQPILVRRHGAGYQLVAGSRRLRAAQSAGLQEIPVVIREASDSQMLALALVENLQRSDLNPLEAALAYKRLADEFSMTQEEIARIVGKNRTTVTNTLRLLSLPRSVRLLLELGKITEGHARALLQMTSASRIEKIAARIASEGLSVRDVERLARASEKTRPLVRRKQTDGIVVQIEEILSEKLGAKTRVVRGRKGGRIEIRYADEAELTRLLEWFRSR